MKALTIVPSTSLDLFYLIPVFIVEENEPLKDRALRQLKKAR
jgi:hypothetical protein